MRYVNVLRKADDRNIIFLCGLSGGDFKVKSSG